MSISKYKMLLVTSLAIVICVVCYGLGSSHPGFASGFVDGVEIGSKLVVVAGVGAYIAVQTRERQTC